MMKHPVCDTQKMVKYHRLNINKDITHLMFNFDQIYGRICDCLGMKHMYETMQTPVAKRSASGDALLLVCAGVIAVAFGFAVVSPMYLWESSPPPSSSVEQLVALLGTQSSGAARFALAMGAALMAYAGALRFADRARSPWVVIGPAIAFGLLALLSAPSASVDVYHYLAEGQIAVHYGLNPLVVASSSVPGYQSDPILSAVTGWANVPARYGPLHVLLMSIVVAVTGGQLIASIVGLKLLAYATYLAAIPIILLLSEEIRPNSGKAALIAFAWNPEILLDGVANAHNDLIMAVLTCAGLLFIVRRSPILGACLIMAGAMIKFLVIVIVPLALIYASIGPNRSSPRHIAIAAIASIAVLIATYFPFYSGWESLPFATMDVALSNSLFAMVNHLSPLIATQMMPALFAVFVIVYLASAYALARKTTAEVLLKTAVLVVGALVVLIAKMWWPWYAITILALLAPLVRVGGSRFLMALTAGVVLAWVLFLWRWLFGAAQWNGPAATFLIGGAMIAPVALVFLLAASEPTKPSS